MRDYRDKRFLEDNEISGPRRALSRREPGMKNRILDILRGEPMTVPGVAEILCVSPHEAMWWMMGCARYGHIAPTGEVTEDGYYKYAAVERED